MVPFRYLFYSIDRIKTSSVSEIHLLVIRPLMTSSVLVKMCLINSKEEFEFDLNKKKTVCSLIKQLFLFVHISNHKNNIPFRPELMMDANSDFQEEHLSPLRFLRHWFLMSHQHGSIHCKH